MTLTESNLTVDQVQSVRDRSLVEAYEPHDVAQEIITRRLKRHGFFVEQHGDDARHVDEIMFGDGPDIAVYRLQDNVERNDDGLGSTFINTNTGRFVNQDDAYDLVCYIEIKSKESQEWYGRCNRRHFDEYVNFANEVDVPVFIWFALVDSENNACLRDDFFEVDGVDQIEGKVVQPGTELVFDKDQIEPVNTDGDREIVMINSRDIINMDNGDQVTETIPAVHGNQVVCLDEDQMRSTAYILSQLT